MLTLLVLAIPLAFGVGLWTSDLSMRRHWQRYKFCPNCDRLDCPREHGDVVSSPATTAGGRDE